VTRDARTTRRLPQLVPGRFAEVLARAPSKAAADSVKERLDRAKLNEPTLRITQPRAGRVVPWPLLALFPNMRVARLLTEGQVRIVAAVQNTRTIKSALNLPMKYVGEKVET
jgi:hypothetical protein